MTQLPSAFGLYPSTRALHFGAEALRAAKFRHTDISVMYSDGQALAFARVRPRRDSVADARPASLGDILTSLSGLGAVAMANDGPFMAGGPDPRHPGRHRATTCRDRCAGWASPSARSSRSNIGCGRAGCCSRCSVTTMTGRRERAKSWRARERNACRRRDSAGCRRQRLAGASRNPTCPSRSRRSTPESAEVSCGRAASRARRDSPTR